MAKKKSYVIKKISDGFLELLYEHPFADITVSDLVRKAGVARVSFYRNFDSTADVLELVVSEIIGKIYEITKPVIVDRDQSRWRECLYGYILFLNESQNYYNLLKSQNITMLLNHFIESVRELVTEKENDDLKQTYSLMAALSLINGVLIKWRETGAKESVDDIVNYLMEFTPLF